MSAAAAGRTTTCFTERGLQSRSTPGPREYRSAPRVHFIEAPIEFAALPVGKRDLCRISRETVPDLFKKAELFLGRQLVQIQRR